MKIFRVVDFETTGFPPNAGIVEIGATDLVWEGTQMTVAPTTHAYLTNPLIDINIEAMAVHHITPNMIADAPHPADVLSQIEDGADYIVAHNLQFEAAFHDFNLPAICTYNSAKGLWPNAPSHKNQVLRYWLNLDLDLSRANPAHRAGPDTYVTAHVLKQLLIASAKQGGDFIKRLIDLTHTNPNVTSDGLQLNCEFGVKHRGHSWEFIAKTDPGFIRWVLNSERAEPAVRKTAQHWANVRNIRP